jgi:DNA-binding NarL/FixJ family response regulator
MGEIHPPCRIAIADDSPAFVAAAAGYVASMPGFVVAGTAENAGQALALVRAATPDVLLLDLGMAPARGLEVVRDVKAVPGAPVVVAMTLFHSREAAAAARHAGADGLVGKEAFVSGLTQILAALFPSKVAA